MRGKGKGGVRVISGEFKGRALEYPSGVRPTMQRTKSSVFATLGAWVRGGRFVDLYAASGGIGIEALSRGASFVCFVERDRRALELLRRNLDRLGVSPARYVIHGGDVLSFVQAGLPGAGAPDIIHADPPYDSADFAVLLELLAKIVYPAPVLIVVEHPRDVVFLPASGVVRVREKTFGQTRVSLFRCGPPPA